MRRSRLLGLVGAVALAAAGLTSAVFVAVDPGTQAASQSGGPRTSVATSVTPSERCVSGVVSLSSTERAAAFGGPRTTLDTMGLSPRAKRYVQGVISLHDPGERAAAFGGQGSRLDGPSTDPTFGLFVKGITSMAQARQQAGSGR